MKAIVFIILIFILFSCVTEREHDISNESTSHMRSVVKNINCDTTPLKKYTENFNLCYDTSIAEKIEFNKIVEINYQKNIKTIIPKIIIQENFEQGKVLAFIKRKNGFFSLIQVINKENMIGIKNNDRDKPLYKYFMIDPHNGTNNFKHLIMGYNSSTKEFLNLGIPNIFYILSANQIYIHNNTIKFFSYGFKNLNPPIPIDKMIFTSINEKNECNYIESEYLSNDNFLEPLPFLYMKDS